MQKDFETLITMAIVVMTLVFNQLLTTKQLKNSREGRCVTRMFWGPFLVDRMMGG